jgi:GMP synthase (glutamine-hydrolysing)
VTTIVIAESNPPGWALQTATRVGAVMQEIAPGLTVRVVAPYAGPLAADAFADADGVVFPGSTVEWNTSAPEAAPLRAALVAALDGGRPVFGICNGMQLAASALGGCVAASPNGSEIVVARAIVPTAAGAAHPMLKGRKPGYSVFCAHRDEVVDMPPEGVVLAGNAHSPVQAMALRAGGVDFWGCQYHVEFDTAIAAEVAERTGQPASVVSDLRAAATDAAAAARVGMRIEDLEPEQHRAEIRNWLSYVMAGQ